MNDDVYRRAHALQTLGRDREALALISSALADHPDDADLLELAALCHEGLGNHYAMLVAAEGIVRNEPAGERGHRHRSRALLAMNRFDEATTAAQVAVGKAPYFWLTHVQLAMAAAHSGRPGVATAAGREATRLAPDEPDAHFAEAYAAAAFGWRDEARRSYERVLALRPGDPRALNNLAQLSGALSFVQPARHLTSALSEDPRLELARENLKVLLDRFIGFSYVAGILGLVALTWATYDEPAPNTATVVILGVLLAAVLLPMTQAILRLPAGARRFGVHVLRTNAGVAIFAFGGVLLLAFCAAGALLPQLDGFFDGLRERMGSVLGPLVVALVIGASRSRSN